MFYFYFPIFFFLNVKFTIFSCKINIKKLLKFEIKTFFVFKNVIKYEDFEKLNSINSWFYKENLKELATILFIY